MLLYTLLDGTTRHRKNPDKYPMPEIKDRLDLPAGCFVKLGFLYTKNKVLKTEFLLVQVNEKEEGADIYYGELDDKPKKISGVVIGDMIQFSSNHVLEIISLH